MVPNISIANEGIESTSDGDSEGRAARSAGGARRRGRPVVSRKGGHTDSYYDWNVNQLKTQAKELGLSKYSALKKLDLIYLLRDAG